MEDKIEEFLLSCFGMDFGTARVSQGEKKFCNQLNHQMVSLCKSLPKSTQTDSLLLLLRYFRIPMGQAFSFFKNYYAPAWSIIYWLIHCEGKRKGLRQKDIKNAIAAHSMALLLHPLDDHLNDRQMPVTHLTLLIRSQAWMIMRNAFEGLAGNVDGGRQIVADFIDDYYAGIRSTEKIEYLEGYLDLFKKQMATGFVVPVLLSAKIGADKEFAGAIQAAYGSFGIAWRLLDDINDIKTDMMKGTRSAIYICLPKKIRLYWEKEPEEKTGDCTRTILNHVLENGIIEIIKEKICTQLESAAAIANDHNMANLADQFCCLVAPLKNGQET